eukprot:NODE_1079_length_1014_cov_53.398964_g895_i0.p1 GENE.NODE_1079_length_1014_cov_53.398964_g895_i0~~NODE_1079_length_1014_cov_53.398964_g895_i0.p1  ORF type:complete len:270 (+),score=26.03 NODE_1079_length_1014_cov_53.398964_g895_i0:32-811(+)
MGINQTQTAPLVCLMAMKALTTHYVTSKEFEEQQKGFWNKTAGEKEFKTPFRPELWQQYVPDKSAKVLDWGCGSGRIIASLIQLGYSNVEGLENAVRVSELAKSRLPGVPIHLATSKRTSLRSESYDVVILFETLSCICVNFEQIRLLDEIKRVLKPGGLLIVNEFLIHEDDRNIARYNDLQEMYSQLDLPYGVFEHPEGVILRHHDEAYLMHLFDGFDRLEWIQDTFMTSNNHEHKGVTYVGRKAAPPPLPPPPPADS